MAKQTIEMSIIADCEATECAYNNGGTCHARAITVGDGTHPGCDTYFPRASHVQQQAPAGVGACKVSACKHNQDLACTAELVHIGRHAQHADCMTFATS